jgi:hypothetical protein
MKLRRYLNEAQSRDFTYAKDMFYKTVGTFKANSDKSLDSSTLTLVADMVRYMGKFVEEHAQIKSSSELKDAKALLREAMEKLDIASEKFGDGKVEKKERAPKMPEPVDMEDDEPDDEDQLDTDEKDDIVNEPADDDVKKEVKGSSDPW